MPSAANNIGEFAKSAADFRFADVWHLSC